MYVSVLVPCVLSFINFPHPPSNPPLSSLHFSLLCPSTSLPLGPMLISSHPFPQARVTYGELVLRLGGQVLDGRFFNPACTHLVVGKPSRNEKYLAAVAAGKWVLHVSYLESSREAGCFVKVGVGVGWDPSAMCWVGSSTNPLVGVYLRGLDTAWSSTGHTLWIFAFQLRVCTHIQSAQNHCVLSHLALFS